MPSKKKNSPVPVLDSSSLSNSQTTRCLLKSEEVCVGCILWLPRVTKPNLVKQYKMSNKTLDPEGYQHPVVVLEVDPQPDAKSTTDFKVRFALITTFKNLSLVDYMDKQSTSCRSVAITNAVMPKDSQHLSLEKKRKLQKQSYIRLNKVWETSISTLRSYSLERDSPAYRWRLQEQSYHRLMSILGLEAQEYPSTKAMKAMKRLRGSNTQSAQRTPIIPVPVSSSNTKKAQRQQEASISYRSHSKPDPTTPSVSAQVRETENPEPCINYTNAIPSALLLLIPQQIKRLARACSCAAVEKCKLVTRLIRQLFSCILRRL